MRGAMGEDDLSRQPRIKKGASSSDAGADRRFRHAGRGVDAEMTDASPRGMAKQRAIVAADLDHKWIAGREHRDHIAREAGKVLLHAERGCREERITIVEHPF